MHVVVGGGIWGLGTAWSLVREGHGVTLIDRGPLPNPQNASYDQHRLIRYPYGESIGYCGMMKDAFAAWDDLWRDLGRSHYVECGTLCVSTRPGDWTDKGREGLDHFGIEYERVDRAGLMRRLPFMTPDVVDYALLLETGGILKADRIAESMVAWLERQGVELVPDAEVSAIDPDRAQVATADGRSFSGDRLVITTGCWTDCLLPQYRGKATASRQVVVYLDPPPDIAEAWTRAPVMVDMGGGLDPTKDDKDLWGAPPADGTGLKIGVGSFRKVAPAWTDLEASDEEKQRYIDAWRGHLPDIDAYGIGEARVCYYTMGRDSSFLADPLDAKGRSWAMCACSGHGYKFGPLLGRGMVRMLEGAVTPENFMQWARGNPSPTD